jgi:hypothetical protein
MICYVSHNQTLEIKTNFENIIDLKLQVNRINHEYLERPHIDEKPNE